MRLALALLFVLFVISGCSEHSGPDNSSEAAFSEHAAIAKVIEVHNRTEFPARSGQISGIIHGGGPAPGLQIPGEFESSAVRIGKQLYTVTLTMYWSAQDFRSDNDPPDATLQHYWRYEVSPSNARLIETGGHLSPEEIE